MQPTLRSKRSQHELALQHQSMRNHETVCVELSLTIGHNVQIDIPGTLVNEFDPAEAVLDTLQSIEQVDRFE